MATSTSLYFVKEIYVGALETHLYADKAMGVSRTQLLSVQFIDGSHHNITLCFADGAHALAVGELVPNSQAAA